MRCVVVDVAAASGGALVVSDGFMSAATRATEHDWMFQVSRDLGRSHVALSVRDWRWVKRSWLHRLFFDLFTMPKLLSTLKPDVVLSLQNVAVARTPLPQVIYLHQAIPFSNLRVNVVRDPKIWIYRHILKHYILWSVRRAVAVVVQTRWMKDAVVSLSGVSDDRVVVLRPDRSGHVPIRFVDSAANRRNFFYPARAAKYKNHATLIDACWILQAQGFTDFSVTLTMTRSEYNGLGIGEPPGVVRLVGWLCEDDVRREYSCSTLVFPSVLESLALPPIDAKDAKCFILASDLPFSHETLDGYPNAYFFEAESPEELATLMASVLTGAVTLSSYEEAGENESRGWGGLIELLEQAAK